MSQQNYRSGYDDLNAWLARVPNYEVRETDDPSQVESKLKSQRVRPLTIHVSMFLEITPGQNRVDLLTACAPSFCTGPALRYYKERV